MYFAVLFLIFETYASVVNFQNLLYLKMFSVPYVLICIMSFWFKCYLISIVTSLTNNILGVSFIISNQMEKFYFNFGLTFNACMLSLQLCSTLQPHELQPTRLICPQNSLGKNIGMGSHFLLQGIFLTQGSNRGFLHCKQIPYCLHHQEAPMSGSES